MQVLKYKDLTPEQKKHICNGCGSKGGIINVPDFIFQEDCNEHDFEHWLGHTEKHRKESNKKYYKRMRVSISSVRWYLKPYYHVWAFTYFSAVVVGSSKYFHYGDKHKDINDLKIEMFSVALIKDSKGLEK